MTLLISIEYRTRWGEQLVLRLGKRRIALQYADGGVWTCAVERYAPAAQPAEYRYEVEREGVCIRSEWRPHTLRIPSREGVRTLRIRDRWQEMPSDTPFYSSAFTRGIFGRGKTGNPKKAAGNITLRVILPTLRPDETLAVAGSGRELGDWKRIVPMDDSRFPEWELTLHTAHRFEYKFLIADRKTLTPILWEEGANRTWGELPGAGEHALDAAAWADYLAGEGFRRVVLIGHSEGALIAFCAAQQTPKVAAVVSLAGAGYPLDEILQLQLASQLLPDNMDLLLQANAITAALKRGERVESCPPQLEALFHPSVQTFWISSLRYDPREEIRKVRVPILVVGGDNDLQVPPDNAEALAKAQPRARKAIIAGMTHPLKKCTGRTRIDQTGAYGDSTLPIDPDLVAVVTEFIRGL